MVMVPLCGENLSLSTLGPGALDARRLDFGVWGVVVVLLRKSLMYLFFSVPKNGGACIGC